MKITLQTVEELAPDQASLTAAKKLLKPAKWPVLGQSGAVSAIWGECQGSGSKPYYTVADPVEHGYKCTCPSRKFPCKHVLALLWQFSEASENFAESEPPQWVVDWLSRRRRPAGNSANDTVSKSGVKKNINATTAPEKQLTPEEIAKKEAANAKRAAQNKAKTETSINNGLLEFQQWLDDQLVNGISQFIKDITPRCRRIAARLVDAKAANFASRVDEMPAKILSLPPAHQPEAVYAELGKLALLSEAWFTDKNDADIRRAVASSESRDQVLNHPESKRVKGIWQTVGERIETRKDGLIAHSKWLIRIDSDQVQPALLLDYYPASAGRRELISSVGRKIEGELVFYPSRVPTRALLCEHQVVEEAATEPELNAMNYEQSLTEHLSAFPWSERFPCLLGQGRLMQDNDGMYWWQSSDQSTTIAIKNKDVSAILLGSELKSAFVLSDGVEAELMSANANHWGRVRC